jgi:hypothetical protein
MTPEAKICVIVIYLCLLGGIVCGYLYFEDQTEMGRIGMQVEYQIGHGVRR